ncbi:MAG: polysaccharide biosynthesis tyrosine autokinase [Cyclobacteriaceae bacterium]
MITITTTGIRQIPDGNVYYFIINSRDVLLNQLSQNLMVSPINYDAKTILISCKDYNPLKAHDIVGAVDSLYIHWSNEQMNLANKQKIGWLNNELKQIENRMEGYENYFESFTLQNRSVDVAGDLRRAILTINKVDSQRLELGKRLADLNHLIEALAAGRYEVTLSQRSGLPETIGRKLEEVQRLAIERSRISLIYRENTYAFRKGEEELTSRRDQLRNELLELQKNWLQLSADLTKRKANLEREFATMPDKNTALTKNQRFYKLYEDFYLSMVEARAGFEIAQAGSTPNFKILSPASLPTRPISPKRLMIMGAGFVAGIVLNFFLIGILYLANNKITSVREIEHALSVPVLGVIPITNKNRTGTLYVADNPKSRVSEAIRLLRTNLDFFTTDSDHKVVAISSTISGEGKSFLSLNLGAVLALSRKKVILVDLDMRKHKDAYPVQSLDISKGMSTVLIRKHGWKECVVQTPLEYLDYLPSGPVPPNPSELLLHDEFDQMLTEMREHYDFIILDNPPVGLVTDGIMSMKKADLAIYVFRANYSHREFLNQLRRIIQMNKIERLAVVLNAYSVSANRYGYGYYEEERKSKKIWQKPKS